MAFDYKSPVHPGPLFQCEILGNVWEHRPLSPPVEIPEESQVDVRPIHHPMMIVMTAVCDLEQDYASRFQEVVVGGPDGGELDEYLPGLVPHVLMCDVFSFDDLRPRFHGKGDIWRRVQQNQDERYQHFEPAIVEDGSVKELPDLYMDFKRSLSIPTDLIYQAVESQEVTRIAVIPDIHSHDVMHRYYSFLSRVGVPA